MLPPAVLDEVGAVVTVVVFDVVVVVVDPVAAEPDVVTAVVGCVVVPDVELLVAELLASS